MFSVTMTIISRSLDYVQQRIFLILWISLVLYFFYSSFIFYYNGRQFLYLRRILGFGLCISRATASVLNLCSALVLLPLCKKLNQVLYWMLSGLCSGAFFFWLERAKTFHMTVAVTLVLFAVIHSISHFVNLWNFSRGYDEERIEINFASYKNENPFRLLMSLVGLTGVSMLVITLSMGLTSMRVVRRKAYNAFWYTHQLYLMFLVLLIVHPLSGVLKEEILKDDDASKTFSYQSSNTTKVNSFVSIQSKTWMWMAFPLCCFLLDLLWRVFSRNRFRVNVFDVARLPGQVLGLTVSCPVPFVCRTGQYVLLQCLDISLLEWHPFTIVQVPVSSQNEFVIWIRVKGDWTEALERLLLEQTPGKLSVLIDGPFSSPMEGVSSCDIAICVAAGVGITPFVSLLQHMLMNPRSPLPGRIHLLWIVRHEQEITWLAELATKTMSTLREANRPDRLHIELYVTNTKENTTPQKDHIIIVNDKGDIGHVTRKFTEDEKATLLTPNLKRSGYIGKEDELEIGGYSVARKYPLLGCRVRRGRPHWDRVFGYWVHLYPREKLNLFCCGPKKLVKLLRSKCKYVTRTTKTKFTFVHEGFS